MYHRRGVTLPARPMAARRPDQGLPGDDEEFAWSPDGKQIAFVSTGSQTGMFVTSVDGGEVQAVFSSAMYLASPSILALTGSGWPEHFEVRRRMRRQEYSP